MSAPFRNQLEISFHSTQDLINNQKTFPVPAHTGSITAHHSNVRSIIANLQLELDYVKEVISDIQTANNGWNTTRTNMTGTERTADNPIYDDFVARVPFPTALNNLKTYFRALTAARQMLHNELPDPNQNLSTHHLPKLSLPKFAGNCVEYTTFWNSFKAAIHDLPTLSNSVKFNYLKECLEGPALLLVQALPLTDASYEEALRLLKLHFGQPEDINRTLHHALRKLPTVSNSNPEILCQQLRQFVDSFEILYLQMIEQKFDVNSIPVQMELESKLPPAILEEIYKAKEDDDNWDTDDLRTLLNTILKRKEGIKAVRDQNKELNPQQQKPGKAGGHFSNSQNPTGQNQQIRPNSAQQNSSEQNPASLTFAAQQPNNPSKRQPKFPCTFCGQQGHFSTQCQTYKDNNARTARLKELKLCFKCLKANHIAKNCEAKCAQCEGKHHKALCNRAANSQQSNNATHSHSRQTNFAANQQQIPPSPNQLSAPPTPMPTFHPAFYPNFYSPSPMPSSLVQPIQQQNFMPPIPPNAQIETTKQPEPSSTPSTQTNAATKLPNDSINTTTAPVLLKCVRAQFFNPDNPSKTCTGILVMDDASTNSYIKTTAANSMQLAISQPTQMKIGVFNDPSSKTTVTSKTSFGIRLIDGQSLIVKANILDHLTHPTSYIPFNNCQYQLHCFTDASLEAMCITIYIRAFSPSANAAQNALLFSKTKVKPIGKKGKHLTIHKLELIGIVMGCTAIHFVKSQLNNISLSLPLHIWTDSAVALAWINSKTKINDIFVNNRIKTIHSTSDILIRHIPGGENPADFGTKSILSPSSISSCRLWWSGPNWLQKDNTEWPNSHPEFPQFDSNKHQTNLAANSANSLFTYSVSQTTPPNRFIDPSKYSRLPRLLRITTFCLRFISHSKKQFDCPILANLSNLKSDSLGISIPELRSAMAILIRQEQRIFPPPDQHNQSLGLYLDSNQILRTKGRIDNSQFHFQTKEPIYLPQHSPLTPILAYELHLYNVHSSPLMTLSILRRNFWLPSGRRTVGRIISKACLSCRRFTSKPFDAPPFPQLPVDRVRPSPPFSSTGLDYCGPLQLKHEKDSKLPKKFYIAIWVCLTTRAVSLDLVNDKTAYSFLLAYRRFAAKFGRPNSIHSDNEPAFLAVNKALQPNSIPWHLRPPFAAWKGGHYERLIELLKNHLRRAMAGIHPKIFTFDLAQTILAEIETTINSRPIGFDSASPFEHRPIRPIDFLRPLGHSQDFPFPLPSPDMIDQSKTPSLISLWNIVAKIANSFWAKWANEYLLSLRERFKKITPKNQRLPVLGEMCLIQNDNSPRSIWSTGIITKITNNTDGLPDTAEIRTSSGRTLLRSITHLFPLETTNELAIRGLTTNPEENEKVNFPMATSTTIPKNDNEIDNNPTFPEDAPVYHLRNRRVPRKL